MDNGNTLFGCTVREFAVAGVVVVVVDVSKEVVGVVVDLELVAASVPFLVRGIADITLTERIYLKVVGII
jgi:hypothetical protein